MGKKHKTTWTAIRTLLFIIIGLLNTVFIRPEDIGSWKNYAGYAFLIIAFFDTLFLLKQYIQTRHAK